MAMAHGMLDLPAIPRILNLLADKTDGCNEGAILAGVVQDGYGRKALDLLISRGIITKKDGVLRLAETEEGSRTAAGILQFYRQVDRTACRCLLFRGILNSMQYASLVHMEAFVELMQTEGYSQDDIRIVMETDGKEGYVEQVKVIYRARDEQKHKPFPFIPLHYYPQFIMMKSDNTGRLRERLRKAGVFMIEEQYLLGHYPKEIAKESRDYILKEKRQIHERMKNESFDIWWYYRF